MTTTFKTFYAKDRKAWRQWLQKNGLWTKLDHVDNFVIPPDLKKVFAKNKKILKWFEQLGTYRKKQWLYRLANAKLPETTAKRIADLITAANEKINRS